MTSVTVQGVAIPAIGLGTSGIRRDLTGPMVRHALAVGYRHIDTAQNYGNEAEIAAAIAASSVPRADIWLTTKIARDHFRDGDLQRAAEASARNLGGPPDLLLLHWPNPKIPLAETMGALNDVKRRGLAGEIGVSNFTVALVEEAVALSEGPLLVNQVEYHPYLDQRPLLSVLGRNGMALTAYCPLAKGRAAREARLAAIGARHGKSSVQVALRWLIQQGSMIAIPRSSREAHVEANLAVFDFELTADEMAEVFALTAKNDRLYDPIGLAPAWDGLTAADQVRRTGRRVIRAVIHRVRRRLERVAARLGGQ